MSVNSNDSFQQINVSPILNNSNIADDFQIIDELSAPSSSNVRESINLTDLGLKKTRFYYGFFKYTGPFI